jgi:hypothetical protein
MVQRIWSALAGSVRSALTLTLRVIVGSFFASSQGEDPTPPAKTDTGGSRGGNRKPRPRPPVNTNTGASREPKEISPDQSPPLGDVSTS